MFLPKSTEILLQKQVESVFLALTQINYLLSLLLCFGTTFVISAAWTPSSAQDYRYFATEISDDVLFLVSMLINYVSSMVFYLGTTFVLTVVSAETLLLFSVECYRELASETS